MTEIGEHGRLPAGQSWRRAMEEVARRQAEGSRRKYAVRGRRIEPGWWAYEVRKVPKPPPVPVPMTRERALEMAGGLPRCAQRSRARHGGGSKVAWPSQWLADRVAACWPKGYAYQCQLPAPALGVHWHVSTSGRSKRR